MKKKINLIKGSIYFFFILILFIFFVGYKCKYLKPSYCQINFFENILYENGFVENLQILFLIVSIYFLIISFKKLNLKKIIKIFLTIKILALIYYLGEEISWGQHFFKWVSPEFFLKNNNQGETNLHNISNLLDQLPRTLVMLWCGLIPVIFYFIKKNFSLNYETKLIFIPTDQLLKISIFFLLIFLPDFFVDKLSLHPGHVINGKDIPESVFYDIISLNFLRLSEVHELIFCFYFLMYSIAFKQAINNQYKNQ
tara:strand:+ start:60 stop:821 length:762 start_codon:yes stop_codon:yes gene_type:complete